MKGVSGARASAVAILALTGCAFSTGDRLMREGAYQQAEAQFQRDLVEKPDDPALERKRDEARVAAVREKLDKARESRTTGHGEAALALLGGALELESRWKALRLPPDVAALRDDELAQAGALAEGIVAPDLAAGRPLTAGAALKRLDALLIDPKLRPARDGARAKVAAAGQARCAELQPACATPYLAGVLARYCLTFGGARELPALPDQRRGIRVSGRLDNSTEAQHGSVQRWLALAFRDSPWYSKSATALVEVKLSGSYDPKIGQRIVTLSAPYSVVVDASVDRGPLMEPLRITSHQTHVFSYDALEYRAHYEVDADARFELADGIDPVRVWFEAEENKAAYEHNVSFPDAGIRPRRADLPTVGDWLVGRLRTQRPLATTKLSAFWARAFCQGKTLSAEEAARCALGAPRQPGVAAALAPVFGADTDALLERLGQPRPKARASAETPDIVDVSGVEDDSSSI